MVTLSQLVRDLHLLTTKWGVCVYGVDVLHVYAWYVQFAKPASPEAERPQLYMKQCIPDRPFV